MGWRATVRWWPSNTPKKTGRSRSLAGMFRALLVAVPSSRKGPDRRYPDQLPNEGVSSVAQFEVLSPWAEADPVPVRGIHRRLSTLEHKRIGLFANAKRAAPLIQEYVERELKARVPGVEIRRFVYPVNNAIFENEQEWPKFQDWVRSVDAVIGAVGD